MRNPKYMTSKFDGTCSDCERHVAAGETIYWLSRGVIECADCARINQREPVSTAARAQRTAQPAQPATPSQPAGASFQYGTGNPDVTQFDPALSWDDTPPVPGKSIGDTGASVRDPHAASNRLIAAAVARDPELRAQVTTAPVQSDERDGMDHCDDCNGLAELSHHDGSGLALCGDCESKHDERIAAREQIPAKDSTRAVVELSAARIKRDAESPSAPDLDPLSATVCDLLVTLVNCIDRLDADQCDALRSHANRYSADSASGSRRRLWQSLGRAIS